MTHIFTLGGKRILFESPSGLDYRPKRQMTGKGWENTLTTVAKDKTIKHAIQHDPEIQNLTEEIQDEPDINYLYDAAVELQGSAESFKHVAKVPKYISLFNKYKPNDDKKHDFNSKQVREIMSSQIKKIKKDKEKIIQRKNNIASSITTPREEDKISTFQEFRKKGIEGLQKIKPLLEQTRNIILAKPRRESIYKKFIEEKLPVVRERIKERKKIASNVISDIIETLEKNKIKEESKEITSTEKKIPDFDMLEKQELEKINKEKEEKIKQFNISSHIIANTFKKKALENDKKESILKQLLNNKNLNVEQRMEYTERLKNLIKEFNEGIDNSNFELKVLKQAKEKAINAYGKLYQDTRKKFLEIKEDIANKESREILKLSEQMMKTIKEDEEKIKDQLEKSNKTLMKISKPPKAPKPKKETKTKKSDVDYYYKEMLKFRPASLNTSLKISDARIKMEKDLSKLIDEMKALEDGEKLSEIEKIEKMKISREMKNKKIEEMEKSFSSVVNDYKQNIYPGYRMLEEIKKSKEAKEAIKPPELKPINSAKNFEEAFKSETLVKRFLKQARLRDLTDAQIDRAQLKIIETGSNYPQYGYKKDKGFPVDILVDVIVDGVTIKKLAIELKFYDNTNMWTGLKLTKNAPPDSGRVMTFGELLEIQNTFYNDYKGVLMNAIREKTKIIFEDKQMGNDTTTNEAELSNLRNILSSDEQCTKTFNDNVFGTFVGMKVTKTGYRFSEVTEATKGINTLEFYQNLKKYQNIKSPRMILNHDGIIEDVYKPRKDERYDAKVKGGDHSYYDLLEGRELLFCVSFQDACVICDYSKKIREGFFDPLNVFKNVRVTKSMYGGVYHADSMAIPLEYFYLFH